MYVFHFSIELCSSWCFSISFIPLSSQSAWEFFVCVFIQTFSVGWQWLLFLSTLLSPHPFNAPFLLCLGVSCPAVHLPLWFPSNSPPLFTANIWAAFPSVPPSLSSFKPPSTFSHYCCIYKSPPSHLSFTQMLSDNLLTYLTDSS